MEWLGHAKIGFTHPPNPINFKSKDGSTTDLLKICEESTPPCRLNPLLFNGKEILPCNGRFGREVTNSHRSHANVLDSCQERWTSHFL